MDLIGPIYPAGMDVESVQVRRVEEDEEVLEAFLHVNRLLLIVGVVP